jgi:hypothetical protein
MATRVVEAGSTRNDTARGPHPTFGASSVSRQPWVSTFDAPSPGGRERERRSTLFYSTKSAAVSVASPDRLTRMEKSAWASASLFPNST